jgi:F-type H+-transporting ATPase subunit epsilon
MNRSMTVEILTPDSRRLMEDAVFVNVFLTDGSIGILPGHAPLLGETGPRPILCRIGDGRETEISPGPGILQVEGDRVAVFAVSAGGEGRPFPARLLRNLCAAAGIAEEADETEAR